MSDKVQPHPRKILFHNKVEYALFYEKSGVHHDIRVRYPSLESAQSSLDFDVDRDQLAVYQRPTAKEWRSVE